MHGDVSTPSCCAFIHRFAFKEVSWHQVLIKSTVRNVVDFGCFIDIGVHEDGLLHISRMADKFVKHPRDLFAVGDVVDVKIESVDTARKRISLTRKGLKSE